ncbi:DNA/RNA-binding protein KIN17 [Dermacentor andersoni]|uniref:DNA/RNA-binding protein KIN17 n=1 Tax=Dermacentor andersoni TaxID=34620 RepID=UPI00215573B6|nr:DNA/RNA-binding protein KIN17-like [Dermacentor andersoni]XP_050032120.1 DNA/RNA-binding protein KIN17-like [Dermacentor andersoni]
MPKHDPFSPKGIANRIKSKGLQKLRWYCQMCQKQCRDENGFKCHTMSESHQRQLLLFAECPGKYLGTFSQEFAETFLELLKRRFGTKRVHANQVYQEYIADKQHLHMNATRWLTLTSFVKWLGREGHCTVDETEKGWFITYIDRDPDTIKKQESLAKKEKLDLDDQDRLAKFIDRQIERDRERKGEEATATDFTELKRENEEEKVVFKLAASSTKQQEDAAKKESRKVNPLEVAAKAREKHKSPSSSSSTYGDGEPKPKKPAKLSALDEIMQEQEKKREKTNRRAYWITRDIVVKVMAKKLGEKYYKKKGVVEDVQDRYVATVRMLDSNDVLRLDQSHLETVIPNIGRRVKVVNGAYRGQEATLLEVDQAGFCAKLRLDSGLISGRVLEKVPYEDFSKLHVPS